MRKAGLPLVLFSKIYKMSSKLYLEIKTRSNEICLSGNAHNRWALNTWPSVFYDKVLTNGQFEYANKNGNLILDLELKTFQQSFLEKRYFNMHQNFWRWNNLSFYLRRQILKKREVFVGHKLTFWKVCFCCNSYKAQPFECLITISLLQHDLLEGIQH